MLGIFVDLSKAFDTVDHLILLRKLELYGITGVNNSWFKNYLTNRKQFIQINNNKKTDLLHIKCGVPQGSILGPLLFILYVNDLKNASKLLDPIMFADDTNLFLSHKNIKVLFNTMNTELNKIKNWFISNKLSLNAKKTNYTLFHSLTKRDDLPLALPKLSIGDSEIKKVTSIKFLGVLLDENLTWKDHIKIVETKISKNLGLLYRAKTFLNKKSLTALYF